ncbi:MAG: hypothetical protein QXE81_04225 [Desulfurococcaceae archaeon]
MSVHNTRKELDLVLGKGSYRIPSEVYEFRYARINVAINNKIKSLWIFIGRERDYLLIPGVFCNCKDFIFRTVINKTSKFCKHQLGLHIAIYKKKYVEINLDPQRLYIIMSEILSRGFSIELRKVLSRK